MQVDYHTENTQRKPGIVDYDEIARELEVAHLADMRTCSDLGFIL